MKDIGIKLTFYDFLGYFIPGLLLIFVITLNKCFLDNFSFSNKDIKLMLDDLSINIMVIGVVLSYITGFMLNGLGSLVFENFIFKKFVFFSKKVNPFELLPRLTIDSFKTRFKDIYGKEFEEKDRQGIISYVSENKQQIYSRAFFFLVIYGFSRTIMTVFFLNIVFLCYFLFSTSWAWIEICISTLVFFIFAFNYVKFRQYYEKESIYGFIIK